MTKLYIMKAKLVCVKDKVVFLSTDEDKTFEFLDYLGQEVRQRCREVVLFRAQQCPAELSSPPSWLTHWSCWS